MKYLAVLVLAMALVCSVPALAEDKPTTHTIVKDWGNFISGTGDGAIINVKIPLTDGKEGLSLFFTNGDFGKITKSATDQAKKLFTQIYAINGISNMRFSTYQIILNKAGLFDFPNELGPDIFAAMDGWYKSVKINELPDIPKPPEIEPVKQK